MGESGKKQNFIYLIIALLLPVFYIVLNELWIYSWHSKNISEFLPAIIQTKMVDDEYCLDAIFCMLLAAALLPTIRKIRENDKFFSKAQCVTKMSTVNFLKSVVIALGISGLSMLCIAFVDTFFGGIGFLADGMKDFEVMFGVPKGGFGYFCMLMSVALFGPIVEEFIFRGIMFSALRQYVSGGLTVTITAVYFGIWHMNVIQSIYTIVFGLIIGAVYLATKNLWFPVIIHIVNNSVETPPPFLENNEIFMLSIDTIKLLAIFPALLIIVNMILNSKSVNAAS